MDARLKRELSPRRFMSRTYGQNVDAGGGLAM